MNEPIGYAQMAEDGTIQLFIRAETEDGLVGHGLLIYSPRDPDYRAVLAHIGALEPGRWAAVMPWAD